MNFSEWLIKEKEYSLKASHDVASRLKRVQSLLGVEEIPQNAVERLEAVANFKILSMSVKSQLRRASKLYLEYKVK